MCKHRVDQIGRKRKQVNQPALITPARPRPLRRAQSDESNTRRMPRMETANNRIMRFIWLGKRRGVGTYTAREHDVEQDAERPVVDFVRVRQSKTHFGSSVGQGSHLLARHVVIWPMNTTIRLVQRDTCEARICRNSSCMPMMTTVWRRLRVPGKDLGHAEICEDDMAIFREEDVCRFDVPVYYAPRMQVFQSTN